MTKLLYFSAQWCGPCKTFGPVMDRVSQSGIPVEKIDVDQQGNLAAQYSIRNVPTVIKVNASGNAIDKFVGVKSEQQVREFYNG